MADADTAPFAYRISRDRRQWGMLDWVAGWPPPGPTSAAGSDLDSVWVGVVEADAAAVADAVAGNSHTTRLQEEVKCLEETERARLVWAP